MGKHHEILNQYSTVIQGVQKLFQQNQRYNDANTHQDKHLLYRKTGSQPTYSVKNNTRCFILAEHGFCLQTLTLKISSCNFQKTNFSLYGM